MLLTLTGHSFRFECENLCRVFFPYSPVRVPEEPEEPAPGESWAETRVVQEPSGGWCYTVRASDGRDVAERQTTSPELAEYPLTRLLYEVLSGLTGISPAWGMLTGVHPVKLLRQHVERLGFESGAEDYQSKWLVSPARVDLAKRVLSAQKEAVDCLSPQSFSLYVGIPFCPTRCAYCSFISQDMQNAKKLVEPYLRLLHQELERTAQIAEELDLELVSVYVGGGTPTTLSPEQLEALCGKITSLFSFGRCREFTVEAGRPDSITPEKLLALKDAGVTRISINPQTMSDRVLENIGRRHTARDVEEAFALAQSLGFEDINADLIVGLPGDDFPGFQETLDRVLGLGPSSVTVHSLALKRSAAMVTEEADLSLHKRPRETAAMVDHSIRRLTGAGFEPYYLYRQTRMAGNLENTGWAKPGCVCRYNIYTMDESGSVIACGAGGTSKLKDPYSSNLKRVFNFKFPFEYISRHQEILERKDQVKEIYEQFCQRLH
ncbi:coproporphyrinogen dehydrogenase HemZ [Acutalibacter sp. 1XD8-33]|uniref:coproporphyrinogen dehydrogenase HemZ n=1 Tax=Acutalibacter sp. 1XD8-33 TaxID=2320081 RepID=UPI000EA0F298|nr:coproporphyrinogen dehydrogenase HemZ [Acutalibacter sp. 1XD8-33]RKJ39325.1 coproporphyrinogen dehydrogenase HemZ [Acutalibacter sp. 1XD8-33]